jgi:hypothetical protein
VLRQTAGEPDLADPLADTSKERLLGGHAPQGGQGTSQEL